MPEPTPTSNSEFIKSIRDTAFLIAVYLYFAGWIYIYTYFGFFGISLGQADIEFYSFLIYSVNVMTYLIIGHWFISLCFVLLCSAILHWLRYSWVKYAVSILFFAALYVSAIFAGNSDARTDFAYQGSGLTKIKFVLSEVDTKKPDAAVPGHLANRPDTAKNDTSKAVKNSLQATPHKTRILHFITENLTDDFITYNEQDQLRLMLDGQDEYVVLAADDSATYDNALTRVKRVYFVPKDKIKLARTLK